MKMIIAILAVMFNICATENPEKIYLDENAIVLDQEKLYVNLNEVWIETSTLREDTNGYYILANDIQSYWYCQKCSAGNEYWRGICRRCGSFRNIKS